MDQQWEDRSSASAFVGGMDGAAQHALGALEAMAAPVCHWRLSANPPCLFPPGRGAIPLSAQDYAVLRALARGGDCVTREAIVDVMRGDSCQDDQRRLDTQMRRLRRKVEEASGLKLPISTVRAVGYRVYQRIEICG